MTTIINNYKHHTITTDGVVTNLKTGVTKSVWVSKSGYRCVDIYENGKAHKHYIHRLLAETFIPNPENKRTVNHKNGNKLDNRLSNLEWNTDSENISHAYANGLNRATNKKVLDTDLHAIYGRYIDGESLTEIIKDYSFSLSTVSVQLSRYVDAYGKRDEFESEKAKQKLDRSRKAKHKTCSVIMLDVNTSKKLRIFESIQSAVAYLNKRSSGPISNNLRGLTKSAYGYRWVRVLPQRLSREGVNSSE